MAPQCPSLFASKPATRIACSELRASFGSRATISPPSLDFMKARATQIEPILGVQVNYSGRVTNVFLAAEIRNKVLKGLKALNPTRSNCWPVVAWSASESSLWARAG